MTWRSPYPIAFHRLALPVTFGLAALFVALLSVRAARADMAPFPAQEGNSLAPSSSTAIQMISETVLIQVADFTETVADTSYTIPGANVVADFVMHNPGAAAQALEVGFPMQVPKNAGQAGDYVKIKNLAASVGGVAIETRAATVGGEIWSAWQMNFPPGDTTVRVTYDLPVTSDACNAELGYVIHTGAAWAGSIGRADLIVRYPYAAEATFLSPNGIYLGDTTPGYQVEGTDLHWQYDNLEPTPANDLAVTFVAPDCWLKVAAARTAVNQHPTADNYWHLASAYADIVFPHHGFFSPLIAQIADAQFHKALALDPQNPQINAGYAEFLFYQFGGPLLPNDQQSDVDRQCARALTLLPNDDVLGGTCGYFLNSEIGDPNVSAEVQATAAAVLTAVAQPATSATAANTAQLATPIAAANTALAVASPSPSPRPTSAPIAASPTPPATLPPSPQPVATLTPIVVAQVNPAPSSTPVSAPTPQPGPYSLPIAITLALIVLALIAGGTYYWRRQRNQ